MSYLPTIQHPFLGQLEFDPQMVWYAGRLLEEDQHMIQFNIGIRDLSEQALTHQLDHAHMLLSRSFYQDAIQQMSHLLLPIKNAEWLETDESPLLMDEFLEQIELKGILIYEDGTAELNLSDEGIFWGHDIIIYTDASGVFEEAHLAD